MRSIDLVDPYPPRTGAQPERVLLLVEQVPEGADHWGVLESLRGTSWAAGVKEIPADALSHALHGRLLPLLQALGREPHASARRVTLEEGLCASRKGCIGWDPVLCRPGGVKGLGRKRVLGPPECYTPPLAEGTPVDILDLFVQVALAWKEGRHVVVVRGDGFNVG